MTPSGISSVGSGKKTKKEIIISKKRSNHSSLIFRNRYLCILGGIAEDEENLWEIEFIDLQKERNRNFTIKLDVGQVEQEGEE